MHKNIILSSILVTVLWSSLAIQLCFLTNNIPLLIYALGTVAVSHILLHMPGMLDTWKRKRWKLLKTLLLIGLASVSYLLHHIEIFTIFVGTCLAADWERSSIAVLTIFSLLYSLLIIGVLTPYALLTIVSLSGLLLMAQLRYLLMRSITLFCAGLLIPLLMGLLLKIVKMGNVETLLITEIVCILCSVLMMRSVYCIVPSRSWYFALATKRLA